MCIQQYNNKLLCSVSIQVSATVSRNPCKGEKNEKSHNKRLRDSHLPRNERKRVCCFPNFFSSFYSLVELPFTVVKGTDLSRLEPARDAVEVEGMVAHTPGHRALIAGGGSLVGLTLYACVVSVCVSVCVIVTLFTMIKLVVMLLHSHKSMM